MVALRPRPRRLADRGVRVNVQAHWDEDARVWWADSDDIPGLVTEAETLRGLMRNIHSLAYELFQTLDVNISLTMVFV